MLKAKPLIVSLVLLISILSTMMYMRSYGKGMIDNWQKFFVICGDMGQYFSETELYSKSSINTLSSIVGVNKEPGFLLNSSALVRIAGIHSMSAVIFLCALMSVCTCICVYLFSKKLSNSTAVGLISFILFCTIFLNSLATKTLFPRQQVVTFLLIVLAYVFTKIFDEKSSTQKRYIPLLSLLFAGSMISHLFGIIIGSVLLTAIGFYDVWRKRENYKYYLTIAIFLLFFTLPYFLILFDFILFQIQWKLNIIPGVFDSNILFTEGVNMSGWSLFESRGGIESNPLWHYFYYQPFVVIGAIFGLSVVLKKKKGGEKTYLLITLLILIGYGFFNIAFGIRSLLTTEVFFIIFLSFAWQRYYNKTMLIITFCLFMLVSLNSNYFSYRIFIVDRVREIHGDKSLEFIKEKIPENSFLLGSTCVTELGTQLGYRTSHNFPPLLLKYYRRDAYVGLDFFNAMSMSHALTQNLAYSPDMISFLEGEDIYILLDEKSTSLTVLNEIKNGVSPYLNKQYLKLVYGTNSSSDFIRYVFKVENSYLKYFINPNYLWKNQKYQVK